MFSVCHYCGLRPVDAAPMTRDHIVPRSLRPLDGLPSIRKTVLACRDCNSRKSSLRVVVDGGDHCVTCRRAWVWYAPERIDQVPTIELSKLVQKSQRRDRSHLPRYVEQYVDPDAHRVVGYCGP